MAHIKPLTPSEFDALDDDFLLRTSQFVSTQHISGPFQYGRSYWWRRVKEGLFPQPKHRPGRTRATDPCFWTKRDVINAITALEAQDAA